MSSTDWIGHIENDPLIAEALKERHASDIMVVHCGVCGFGNYYNQGSHCNCRNCGHDLMPLIEVDEYCTLADYWAYAPYPCDREAP